MISYLDAMDNCTMLTDYLTGIICYENYSACAESCHIAALEG